MAEDSKRRPRGALSVAIWRAGPSGYVYQFNGSKVSEPDMLEVILSHVETKIWRALTEGKDPSAG